jgi:ATP-dependent DNA helicase RecG
MSVDDIVETVSALRRIGGEPESIEVKSGAGGLPKSVRETLSAFSNTAGGTVIVGLDEARGFTAVRLDEPTSLRDRLVQMARDELTPPIQIGTEVVPFEGGTLVIADVPAAREDQRPVFVTTQGVSNGSYLRSGDGDHRMSEGELALVMANRTQPRYDVEPVPGTSLSDLDRDSVLRTLQRVRRGSPTLARESEPEALHRIGVLAEPDESSPLTLAGLLTFGVYPQQQFPQLMVSVVVHPPEGERGVRFLDNATLRGSVPEIVDQSLRMLRRNLAARAENSDTGRVDRIEFPMAAIREAIVNALLHRDYSPVTRGTQVQVELFPENLTVRSPGGLYGNVSIDDLGTQGVSSSRNATLASLLSDTYMPNAAELVAENRSSGIRTMFETTRAEGLPRPQFRSTVTSFVVTFERSQLLGSETRAWIARVAPGLPTPAHEIAVAMLRHDYVTNASLRQWGVDRFDATRVLHDLVATGIAVKEGGRRYAQYVLDPSLRGGTAAQPTLWPVDDVAPLAGGRAAIESALRSAGEASASELRERTELSRPTIQHHVRALIDARLVEPLGAPTSPKRRYRWIGPTAQEQPR